jgi:hypothetical protein
LDPQFSEWDVHSSGCKIAGDFSVETQNSEKRILASPTSWLNVAVRVSLGLLLGVCLVLGAREAVASLLAAKKSPDSLTRAALWDSSNPDFPARYARKLAAQGRDADPRAIARALDDATRLGPHRAENWAGLGEALEKKPLLPLPPLSIPEKQRQISLRWIDRNQIFAHFHRDHARGLQRLICRAIDSAKNVSNPPVALE